MAPDPSITRREIELKELDTVARIRSRRYRPIINLINGRARRPTGQITCIKAGMMAAQWESIRAEKPMIELCEVVSPVTYLRSQPHGLVMKVIGRRYPMRYRPDLEIDIDVRSADRIDAGEPFWEVVTDWTPPKGKLHTVKMIVEVKDDEDPRMHDADYNHKLDLANDVYRSIGWRFAKVIKSRDIISPTIARAVREYMLDHDSSIGPADIDAMHALAGRDTPLTVRDALAALGGKGNARARLAALHVRRIVSVDLRENLSPDSRLHLVDDGKAIFELPGRYPW